MTLQDNSQIRAVQPEDAAAITAIYNHYVLHSVATFETASVDPTEMASRIRDTQRRPWLVFERDGVVAGYAYACPWKERQAYSRTVETTVYVAHGQGGKGIGKALYEALIALLRQQGIHAALGGISLPNAASIALHDRLGFSHVGTLREVGYKQERWVDVGYWEMLLSSAPPNGGEV